MQITIAGIGYVGYNNAIALAQHNKVIAYDISAEKIKQLKDKNLNLMATNNPETAFVNADFIVISTPTDYSPELNYFNTTSIENVIKTALNYNQNAIFVIKSTIPIGYTNQLREQFEYDKILFCPEFLREDHALHDVLCPDRIVIGFEKEEIEYAHQFVNLLIQSAKICHIPVVYTGLKEAEAIKLFANAYLAMRVAFFNELDTFTEIKDLNTKEIIKGICFDKRIGDKYNNPSFGYGGYCLPKDTQQLLANYENIPQSLIQSIVESNVIRKEYIAKQILNKINKNDTVGIYRTTMKANSDNSRSSAVLDIIDILKENDINIIIYEPTENKNDFDNFVEKADLIIANRIDEKLLPHLDKVYSRDLFFNN